MVLKNIQMYKIFKIFEALLNRVTMYRLVFRVLFSWFAIALILSSVQKLSFEPYALLYSFLVIFIVSFITQKIFVSVFKVQANTESTYITAFILTFIISPPVAGQYYTILPVLIWVGIFGVAVKYILAISKKHIFNPVAITVVITSFTIGGSASWWVGTAWMLPFVLVGGLLIVWKIRRFELVLSFLSVAILSIVVGSLGKTGLLTLAYQIFLDSPIIFFATIMLTEPLTTPPTKIKRMLYGAFTGLIYAPYVHIGTMFSTPELALGIGNIFSWLISPKRRYVLTLQSVKKIARDTGEFVFSSDHKVKFKPGQYMELTLAHRKADTRGSRRYFTIASSPTENEIAFGIKFNPKKSSSFKTALAEMEEGQFVFAGQVAGDFILPKNKDQKLCFIAGGIGITPFRSMIAYMLDKNEQRDVVLVYSCKRIEELAYTHLIHRANTHLGLKAVSTLSDTLHIPDGWDGYKGFVEVDLIINEVPDYLERMFYVSGPNSMVAAVQKILLEIGVDKKNIKIDYFPGF